MTEIPIACTLSGRDYQRRMDAIAAVGRNALIDASSRADVATLRFRDRPGVRGRLQALVDAEAACCPFLEIQLRERDRALALSITAPDGGEFMVDELIDAFRGAAQ